MKKEADQEKNYIRLITKKISEKLKLGHPESWQQRDYENMGFVIEEKTGISLSVSTLKRIAKNQFQNIPQKNTLNALAQFLDYKDWYDFKTKNSIKKEVSTQKKKNNIKHKLSKKLLYIPAALIMVFIILLLVFKSQPVQSYSEASFSSRKNVSNGVPNTVIFDYDISMYEIDSAFIQQSWDIRRRAQIKKNEKYSTSVYYYPGFHRAKLLINDQLVKEIPVYITTNDWLCVIQNPKNDLIPIYVKEKYISNSCIYISPNSIEKHNVNLADNDHYTSFYYVNDNFNGDSDNFSFETRIKNSIYEGARVCQHCEISILGEAGRHVVQFCDPGCIGKLFLKFGRAYVSGHNNDLSAFGANLNVWNDVKLEIKEKLVTVSLNGNVIYKSSFENSNGPIKGISYRFAGSGSVDYSRLYDSSDQLIFEDEFDRKPVF